MYTIIYQYQLLRINDLSTVGGFLLGQREMDTQRIFTRKKKNKTGLHKTNHAELYYSSNIIIVNFILGYNNIIRII